MEKQDLWEILEFTRDCDTLISNKTIGEPELEIAKAYLTRLKSINKEKKSALCIAIEQKLDLIVKQLSKTKSNNLNKIKPQDTLKLLPVNSISKFIISLIKEKRITDPELIARYAYIELCKYVYYDISYAKVEREQQKIIVNTQIDVEKANLFSYVVCTQWLELYTYILSNFGLKVEKKTRPGFDHVWGEVDLHNGKYIIVDATSYIGKSIDLSNAKSMSPTKGFLIVPKEYKDVYLVFLNREVPNEEERKKILSNYKENRDLDLSLGYIESSGYPAEIILKENELFQKDIYMPPSIKERKRYMINARKFLSELPIPKNMDGYEVFAYYNMFLSQMPDYIRANIRIKTLYADTFSYKQRRLKQKYLEAPDEYLKYLQELVYDRYYQYLNDGIDNTDILSKIRSGLISGEELSKLICEQEMNVSQINRRLNPYYAINELVFYGLPEEDAIPTFQYYEPSTDKKTIKGYEEASEYKKLNKIL